MLAGRRGQALRRARTKLEVLKGAAVALGQERRPRVGYLGFAGQRNLGDDAIRDAHVRWTLQAPVNELPVHHTAQVATLVGSRRTPVPVLLGGGTLLGRADWLRRVRALDAQGWASAWEMLGVGVEDPAFQGRKAHASWADLRGWAAVLPLFGEVTVRGPLSQATLQEVGVASRVVGDPALLFAEAEACTTVREDLVAMSVAMPEDVWGGDPGAVVDAMAAAGRSLVDGGRRLRLMAMHPRDVAPSQAVAAAVGRPDLVEIRVPRTTDELVRDVRDCGVMVGQRLHAVVLASAAYVPCLAVEYRPKCLDFQLSIGRGDQVVSTRGLSSGDLVERTLALLDDREAQSAKVRSGVEPLVRELRRAAPGLRDRLHVGEPLIRTSS